MKIIAKNNVPYYILFLMAMSKSTVMKKVSINNLYFNNITKIVICALF